MKKTRVAAYCRVSRGGAEPEHSLQAQAAYYKEMICAAPSFQFAGIYAEIASGLNIKRRPQFRKLLQDCKKGKVDLIFTKSVSRFARNTVDFLNVIRQLRSWGVDVYFENERILLSKEIQSGMEAVILYTTIITGRPGTGRPVDETYRKERKHE